MATRSFGRRLFTNSFIDAFTNGSLLALNIDPASASYLGHFSAPAVNEPGFEVQAELFLLHIQQSVSPAAEIEEVQWIDPRGDGGLELAPLTRDLILPFYRDSVLTSA